MNSPKYILATIAVFTITIYSLSGQVISDPDDYLYKMLDIWEGKGYLNNLPLLRPYPFQIIEKSLEKIIKKGNSKDKGTAKSILKKLNSSNFSVKGGIDKGIFFHPSSLYELWFTDNNLYQRIGADLSFIGKYSDLFSASGRWGSFLSQNPESKFSPEWTSVKEDLSSGGAKIELTGIPISVEQAWSGGIALGTENLYFQTGLMRTSFGPFYDNETIINGECPEAGHFSFNYRSKYFSFTELLLELTAKYAANTDGSLYTLKNQSKEAGYPSKYMVLQLVEIYPVPWAKLGFVQMVLYGGRFDPLYLIPLQYLTFSQIYIGDYDNSLMGITAQISLPSNLRWNFAFNVDDWNFNEMAKFNFNSGQNKFALQTGLSYTPILSFLQKAEFYYLLITPYMYTHSSFQPINYLTYTNNGKGIGSILEPNSDSLYLRLDISPFNNISINILLQYVRHGEGSYYDDGFDSAGNVNFYGASTFLSQNIIEKNMQMGCSFMVPINLGGFSVTFHAGYTFERIMNKDLIKSDSPAIYHIFNLKVSVSY